MSHGLLELATTDESEYRQDYTSFALLLNDDFSVRYEQRCEEEMLSLVNTTKYMIRHEEDDEVAEYDWSGLDDDFEETALVKSVPRHARPSKRVRHRCDSDCLHLRMRRSEKRATLMAIKRRRRRLDREEINQQLRPSRLFAKSADEMLPKDIAIDFSDPSRRFVVMFLPGGRLLFSHHSADNNLRPGRFERQPRHLYSCHPAAPNHARLNGR